MPRSSVQGCIYSVFWKTDRMADLKSLDAVILGGGIAGLWTLAKLRDAGYDAILIEKTAIGGIQSIASQGIIHGGTKYALGGRLGDSAKSIGDMPRIWKECLDGQGEIDLSTVKMLTETQLMWSTRSAVSRLAGFFAGKLMQDRMQTFSPNDYQPPFDNPAFDGVVYQLNEPVLDTSSLMESLYEQLKPWCFKADVRFVGKSANHLVCEDDGKQIHILTEKLVLTSGGGNEVLLSGLGMNQPAMQRRPIHMVMLVGDLPEIYAHCLGASANPRVTITSSKLGNETVWYVGGGIAETGIDRSPAEQIMACKKELQDVLPWLDFMSIRWATIMLDRTEVATPGNKRPDNSFVEASGDIITAWPTKLAFAPRLAADVLAALEKDVKPTGMQQGASIDLPKPSLALQPWQEAVWN